MALLEKIKSLFTPDEEEVSVKAGDVLAKLKEVKPHLANVDDATLASALAKKYPDKFSYFKNYSPESIVPPALVPKTFRTEKFYQVHRDVAVNDAIATIDKVKEKYPALKSIPAKELAPRLEQKYPELFAGISKKLLGDEISIKPLAGEAEASMLSLSPTTGLNVGIKTPVVTSPAVPPVSVDPGETVGRSKQTLISIPESKANLPVGTKAVRYANGEEAYKANLEIKKPTLVEYPNRNGEIIRRVLAPYSSTIKSPEKKSDFVGALGKATLDTLKNPPDVFNMGMVTQLRTTQNVFSGGASTVAGMLGAVPAMAHLLNADGSIPDGFGFAAKKLNKFAEKIAPKDVTFPDKLMQGAASMAAFWVPGLGAEAAVSKLPQLGALAARIGKVARIAIPTVLEAATEQGGIYNDLVSKGMDKKEAAEKAFQGFWQNVVLLGVTNTISVGPEAKTTLMAALRSAPSEGIQEAVQTVIEKTAKGEKIDWGEVASSGAIGALLGAALGSVVDVKKPQVAATAQAEPIPQTQDVVPPQMPTQPVDLQVVEPPIQEAPQEVQQAAPVEKQKVVTPEEKFVPKSLKDISLEENTKMESDYNSLPDRAKNIANALRDEAVDNYNSEREQFKRWRELIGPGLVAPKVFGGERDVLGEYNTLPIWAKNNGGREIDRVAEEAVQSGLIKNKTDIFEAIRELKAPKQPSSLAYHYADEAKNIYDYESSQEPDGPVDTSFNFQVEEPGFSAEQKNLFESQRENVGDAYTRLVAQGRVRGLSMPEAIKYAKSKLIEQRQETQAYPKEKQKEFGVEGGVQGFGTQRRGQTEMFQAERPGETTPGQQDALNAFNKIMKANKLDHKTFVQFVDSIKVDKEAFRKGYGVEFSDDQFAIRGATYPIKNHPALRALVRFAKEAHKGTGFHESMHVVFNNALTEQERNTLLSKFGSEENAAEAFARYETGRTGKEKPTRIKEIFDKILEFMGRLRNYFDGNGWQTAEDVMRGVSEGRTARAGRDGQKSTQYQAVKKDQTETPEFKRWFGNSVVTDNGKPMSEGGKPLVVYHGTANEFSEYDPKKIGTQKYSDWGEGFYFSPSANSADYYRAESSADSYEKANVLWDLLEEENKKTTWKNGTPTYTKEHDRILKEWRQAREEGRNGRGSILPVFLKIENPYVIGYRSTADPTLAKKAKEMGKDGIIVLSGGGSIDEIVVFYPTQIKSATGNTGAFDPQNPSILYQAERKGDQSENDLIITHNTTAEKILHANRMGGFAVPSLGITKIDSPMEGFGDITLIGDRGLADPKGYAKTNVFGADIYSPRYPDVTFTSNNKSLKKLNDTLRQYRESGERDIYDYDIKVSEFVSDKAFKKYAETKGASGYYDKATEAEKLLRDSGFDEKIFKGYTNSGYRRYIPHTLENVVKILKKELRGGENFNYGAGSLRAKFTPKFKSIEQIKKAKGSLVAKEVFEKVKDEINTELLNLSQELMNYHGPVDMFRGTDIVIGTLEDSAKMGINRALSENQFTDVPGDVTQKVYEFLSKLKNLPTEYFEAKILRGVGLQEFRGAVVPEGTSQEVISTLEKRGLEVKTYKKGDKDSRREIISDLINSLPGDVKFQAERRPGLIDESVYEQNRSQKKGSVSVEIGKFLTSAKDQAESLLTPISSVLADIDPSFRIAFRRQSYREGAAKHRDTVTAQPFLEKAKAMRPEDRADLDLALKNGDGLKIESIVQSYGLEKEYKAVRGMLNAIHARAKEVGYDVGYLEDYWPRVVKDQDGFLKEMKADKKWPDIEKLIAVKAEELKRPLSDDEKVALINSYLRGYQNGVIALARTPNMKTREVEIIGPELNQHFRRFDDAVLRYISSMNHAIEARRFFGRGGKDLFVDELDQSIGHYVIDAKSKGLLKNFRDEKKLKEILNAYFNQESMNGALAVYKDATVAMTLGNVISAVTQLQDIGTAVYRAPGQVIQNLGKAMVGGSKITLEELGLEQVAEELKDERKTALFVSKVLRAAGLSKLDKITAETFINSVISKYQKQASAKELNGEFVDRIRNLVGPDTKQAIEDLRSGEITDLVKFIAFSEILGVQPKAMTELPKTYLAGGNARIFYMLKTFQLRQIDLFRQETFKKMAEPGLKNKVIGTRRLASLVTALLLAGVGTDELKDFLLGRKTTFSDRITDNLLKLAGLSKWTIYKARQEGVGSALMKSVLPPAPLVDQLWKDIRNAGDGKGLEVTQSIPLVGKFYYWWMGRGVSKRPISDDAFYLKENAGRLGLSGTSAYRAYNDAVRKIWESPKGQKRDAARKKALAIASRLAANVRKNEERLLRIEEKRKLRRGGR